MKIRLTKFGELGLQPKHDGYFQYPTPFKFSKNKFGIIYTNRINNESIANYVILGSNFQTVNYSYDKPLIPLGRLGTFHENGAAIQFVKPAPSGDYAISFSVLGTGYSKGVSVPYKTQIFSSAITFSEDGDFLFSTDIKKIVTSGDDLISTCTPSEINGGLIYNSHISWKKQNDGSLDPNYCIRTIQDIVLSSWVKAYTRPWILPLPRDPGNLLITSSRGLTGYRNGPNGYKVEVFYLLGDRKPDPVDIELCPDMKKEQMIAYGTTLNLDGRLLFFYNSSFKSNICIADLEVIYD